MKPTRPKLALLLSVLGGGLAACASVEKAPPREPVAEIRPGILAGYLRPDQLPNGLAFVPPPPAEGSAAEALDEEVHRQSVVLRDSPRWQLAAQDADLSFPHAAGTFSCALGAPVSEADTPTLYLMLRRVLTDAGLSTYGVKSFYQRPRPFVVFGEPSCTPADEEGLRGNGAYPSGHSAIGWAWALVLTEIAPDRAPELLARGRAFGQSRVVCNVHWQSDVVEGRLVASAAVARLHAEPSFVADLAAARDELAAVREKALPPSRDCRAEAAGLENE